MSFGLFSSRGGGSRCLCLCLSCWTLLTAFVLTAPGCGAPARRIAGPGASPEEGVAADLGVVLDANARAVLPRRQVKFFVDITNLGGESVFLRDLTVELTASPRQEPGVISLRESWQYSWQQDIRLLPQRRLTLPIVPDNQRVWKGAGMRVPEFPLETLRPGEYEIRATVNGRYTSQPYALRVYRPDLRAATGVRPAGRPPARRGTE
jgi:hypothetical protein